MHVIVNENYSANGNYFIYLIIQITLEYFLYIYSETLNFNKRILEMSLDLTHLTMFRLNFWPKPFFAPTVPGMENSTFVPTPLSSSALMVLASTSEGRDSQRLPAPHPFSGQSMDKDIPHPSFGAGGFVYRPGDPFSPPLYAPMPPFIRPNLERGLGLIGPGGGGAFRPLGSAHDAVESYHSAFTPAKKSKLDDISCTSSYNSSDNHDQNYKDIDGSRKSLSPSIKEERPSSISSAGGDTNSEIHSDAGDSFDRGTPDSEGRSLRSKYILIV